MAVWLCIRWWYTAGWHWAFQRALVQRLVWCNETFSITALIKTWFAPFKQTRNQGGGSIDMRFHAFIDNVVSRFVGFFARSFIIFTGLLAMIVVLISGAAFLIIWPLIPLALPVALILMMVGVGR